jgi:hypothetical protein
MSNLKGKRQEQRLQQSQNISNRGSRLLSVIPAPYERRHPQSEGRLNHTVVESGSTVSLNKDDLQESGLGFSFGENELWADMFADAGFDIQDGVFFA